METNAPTPHLTKRARPNNSFSKEYVYESTHELHWFPPRALVSLLKSLNNCDPWMICRAIEAKNRDEILNSIWSPIQKKVYKLKLESMTVPGFKDQVSLLHLLIEKLVYQVVIEYIRGNSNLILSSKTFLFAVKVLTQVLQEREYRNEKPIWTIYQNHLMDMLLTIYDRVPPGDEKRQCVIGAQELVRLYGMIDWGEEEEEVAVDEDKFETLSDIDFTNDMVEWLDDHNIN